MLTFKIAGSGGDLVTDQDFPLVVSAETWHATGAS
jgi:hypothetical protein